MNILYVLDNPQLYGSEQHVFNIIQYMKEKHNVYLITFKKGPLLEKIASLNVDYEVIETGYVISKKNISRIIKKIRDNNIDFIHAHQPKALFICSMIKRRLNKTLIITIHSMPKSSCGVYHNLIKKIIVYCFHLFNYLFSQVKADKIIFVSREMYNRKLFKNKSVYISNWLRPDLQIIDHSIPNFESINLLAIGSITAAKGYDKIFSFFDYLGYDFLIKHHVRLTIVGGGESSIFIESQKKKYGSKVFDFINFVGYQTEIGEYLRNSDIFILLSKSETFGLVYLEAMASGLPIIASNLSVLKEIIPNHNCITNNFDDMKNFILKVSNDKELYKQISNKNVSFLSDNFSYQNKMLELESLYKNINK